MIARPVVQRAFVLSAVMGLLAVPRLVAQSITPDQSCLPFSVVVSPKGTALSQPANSTNTASFDVTNTGPCGETYSFTCSATGTIGCVSVDPAAAWIDGGCGGGQTAPVRGMGPNDPAMAGEGMTLVCSITVNVTYTVGATGGNVYLRARATPTDQGWYVVTAVAPPPPPTVSLPYSANLTPAADGVSYLHATPAVGSMGTTQALTLVYNSTAARPVALVFLDVTGPTSPAPSVYEVQVQLVSNGVNLTLMNGATAVYYTATPGVVDRLTAAIDARANGLATGSYPVNLVLTTTYPGSTQTTTVASWILVNDQTASPFGAGVGIAGVGHLYTMTGSYGRLLVDGSGAMEYFDRTCSGCAFVSPAGESGTLVSYSDTLFRLTALDGSFADFNTQGFLVRHNVLPSIQDLTFTWANNLLTAVTDASGRGFTLSYTGGLLTQITDFAGRATSTSIASGRLVKMTDPDGGIDSLTYNSNNLLTQLNSRTGGVWNYGYNPLQQGDTVRAPSATDYTGANVRPTTTVVTAAEVQWQAGISGTSAGAPKGSVRPDTIYLATTDPLGNVTKVQLDRFGQATKVVDALSQVTTIGRDTLGNATWVHEPTGHATTATYIGYFPTAVYDSSTRQSVTYTFGRSTASQGLSAHYGWNDPSGGAGLNQLSLNANDDKSFAAPVYNTLGDPSAGSNLPATDGKYTVQFKLTAMTPTITPGNNSTVTAYAYAAYSTNGGASWTSVGEPSQVTATQNTPGVATTVQVFAPTLTFSGGGPVWISLALRGTATGTLPGGLVRLQVFANTGWTVDPYAVVWSNYSSGTQLLAVQGGPARLDYYYHNGSQGPAGTLREVYVGNTFAPGTEPSGGAVVAWHYPNAYGQDTLVIDGGGHTTRWTYAAAGSGGNLLQTADALGHVTAFHYNGYGLADTTILANGVKQAATYDAINRDTATTNGLGYVTRYAYGATGLARVTDPKRQVYKFDRNPWGVVVAQHDLGDTTKVDSLKYDAAGQARTAITRRGDAITLTYDQLGRPLTRTGPDFPAESFGYGLLAAGGSWTVASSTNGRDSLAYDKAGRLVYAAQHFPGDPTTYAMSYTYDSTGHLINRTAPPSGTSARWVFRPALGILDTMCAVGTCTAVARDTELKPVTVTYNAQNANTWSHTLSYDSLHHVTSDGFTATGPSTLLTSAWSYDSLGRVRYGLGPGGSAYPRETYSYDAAGELLNGCQMQSSTSPCNNEYNQAAVPAYAYDAAGNRIDTTAHPVVVSGNRVTRFKGYALTYDPNGSVIQKTGLGAVGIWTSTDTTTLQWNAIGQLTRVEKWPAGGAHTVVTFRYDALGRRIGKTVSGVTTWFLYDRDQVAMDLDSATHAMRAEYAFTESGDLYALRTPTDTAVAVTTPTIGTVLGIARANGGAVLKAFPDRVGNSPLLPWGQEPADTGFILRYRMGEQEYDQETGLYHMGARYYDPVLGRWLSEDPAGIAGGTNLYTYAGNDPVNGRDPSGLYTCEMYSGMIVCYYYDWECHAMGHTECLRHMGSAFCGSIAGHWDDKTQTCWFTSGGSGAGPTGGAGSGAKAAAKGPLAGNRYYQVFVDLHRTFNRILSCPSPKATSYTALDLGVGAGKGVASGGGGVGLLFGGGQVSLYASAQGGLGAGVDATLTVIRWKGSQAAFFGPSWEATGAVNPVAFGRVGNDGGQGTIGGLALGIGGFAGGSYAAPILQICNWSGPSSEP